MMHSKPDLVHCYTMSLSGIWVPRRMIIAENQNSNMTDIIKWATNYTRPILNLAIWSLTSKENWKKCVYDENCAGAVVTRVK